MEDKKLAAVLTECRRLIKQNEKEIRRELLQHKLDKLIRARQKTGVHKKTLRRNIRVLEEMKVPGAIDEWRDLLVMMENLANRAHISSEIKIPARLSGAPIKSPTRNRIIFECSHLLYRAGINGSKTRARYIKQLFDDRKIPAPSLASIATAIS